MRLGIALGGGGAKGFAHIGVLNALTQAGINCEVVSGTSIGALVGAIYAGGNLGKLEEESLGIKLTDIPRLLSPAWSLEGFFSGKNALERLSDFINVERIEELTKPFAAVSVDLRAGAVHTFTEGPVGEAIRASISIPAVFTPVRVGEHVLVDGGTMEPVPVEAARALGADLVIAVELFGNQSAGEVPREKQTPSASRLVKVQSALNYLRSLTQKGTTTGIGERDSNIIEIIERTLALSQHTLTNLRLQLSPPDFLIQPAVSHIGLLDFHRGVTGIEAGYRAAERVIPELKQRLGIK